MEGYRRQLQAQSTQARRPSQQALPRWNPQLPQWRKAPLSRIQASGSGPWLTEGCQASGAPAGGNIKGLKLCTLPLSD